MKKLVILFGIFFLLAMSCKKEEVAPMPLIKVQKVDQGTSGKLIQGQKDALIFVANIRAATDLNIYELNFDVQAGTSFKNNISFFVAIDNKLVDARSYYGPSVTFSFDDLVVRPTETINVKILAMVGDPVKKGESITLTLNSVKAVDVTGKIINIDDKVIGTTFTVQ